MICTDLHRSFTGSAAPRSPLLSVLGASEESDVLTVFNDSCVMGALSMTCYLFQEKIPVEPEHQRKGN